MLVSICIPAYNHAEFLPEAIESCLNQTYKDIEIIIVDDGSSDNSLEIARQYERTHPSLIQVFTHADSLHHGISATVNLACSKFKGAFYCGLASDDVFYPEKTQRQVNYLIKNPDIGWVYSKAKMFGAMSDIVGTDISQDPDPLETLIIDNRICGQTVLSRRSVWERTGAYDEALVFSDWDFWMRMLGVAKVGFIDEVLAGWRIHSRNTSVGIALKTGCEYALEVVTAWRARHFEPKHLGLINLRRSGYLFELGRLAEARASLSDAFNASDSAAEYLAYFSRLTSPEYRRWALGILPRFPGLRRMALTLRRNQIRFRTVPSLSARLSLAGLPTTSRRRKYMFASIPQQEARVSLQAAHTDRKRLPGYNLVYLWNSGSTGAKGPAESSWTE